MRRRFGHCELVEPGRSCFPDPHTVCVTFLCHLGEALSHELRRILAIAVKD